MQRLFFTLLLIGVVGLILNCSNSGTDSNDNENPADSGFAVSCVGDNTTSVSQAFTATAGGTIEAVSVDGVTFTLEIPAYALPGDNNITLTPLDSFAADGPGYFNCIDVGGGTGFCFEGVLCQPEGLQFDSVATLTVTFPEAMPFPFDSGTTIIYFDTSGSVLYACSTLINQAERRLSCQIHHFSGYTTVNVPMDSADNSCAMLLAEYDPLYQAVYSAAGYQEFIPLALRLLEMKAGNYRSDPCNSSQGWIPCPSFNDQVDVDFITLLNHHVSVLQNRYQPEDPTASLIGDLIGYHKELLYLQAYLAGTSAQSTCEQAVRNLHLFIDGRIRALATIGYTMCQNDDCDGADILDDVLSFGSLGYVVTSGLVVDTAYLQQVTAWRDDCCNNDLTVVLTAPASTTIHRVALVQSEVYADPYYYVCSLNVAVTGPSGTPKPGIPVRLWRTGGSSHFTTFTTNDDGNAGFLLEPRSLDWGCLSEITWEVYAEAYNDEEEEWIASGSVSILFLNMAVTTSISYQYDYSWEAGELHLFKTATLEGSGTAPARDGGLCSGACEGKLTRDYSYDNCYRDMGNPDLICVNASTIGADSTYPCRAQMDLRTMLLDNGLRVEFLYGATVSIGASAFWGLIYEKNSGTIDTLNYNFSTPFPETNIKLWYSDENSNLIGDSTWTYYHEYDLGGGTVYQTADLHVNVSFSR